MAEQYPTRLLPDASGGPGEHHRLGDELDPSPRADMKYKERSVEACSRGAWRPTAS